MEVRGRRTSRTGGWPGGEYHRLTADLASHLEGWRMADAQEWTERCDRQTDVPRAVAST